MLACTGLRWGEATALQVKRVDLMRRRLAVVRNAIDLGREITYGTPKTHQHRSVPIPRSLVGDLAEHIAGQPPEDLCSPRPGSPPAQPQLPQPGVRAGGHRDRRTSADTARPQAHRREPDRSGDPDRGIPPVPVHIVAKRLGHKDASVTLNVYADVIPDDDTSAVDVFSKAVWGA